MACPFDFPIETEVPIPVVTRKRRGPGKGMRYPWRLMKPGNSFFVPQGSERTISSLAVSAGRARGWRFVVRSVDGGVRCWRVA
jgi:hypothetical protein